MSARKLLLPIILMKENQSAKLREFEKLCKLIYGADYQREILNNFVVALKEAAKITKIPHSTIRFWVSHGYLASERRVQGVKRKERKKVLLTYKDITDAMIMKDLIKNGYPLREAYLMMQNSSEYMEMMLTSVLFDIEQFYCEVSWPRSDYKAAKRFARLRNYINKERVLYSNRRYPKIEEVKGNERFLIFRITFRRGMESVFFRRIFEELLQLFDTKSLRFGVH